MRFLVFLSVIILTACSKPVPVPDSHSVGAARPTMTPSSWSIPNWDFDPTNSTGCASDTNTCQSATCGPVSSGIGPCIHYYEVMSRWGTTSPTLQQTTALTWLSSQPDATDPVAWSPNLANGASAIIAGVPVIVATGVLANVTPKNRLTNQLLQAALPTGASNRTMVVNATHPSISWPWQLVTGSTWSLTQPIGAISVPLTGFSPPSEVDTWANGDSVTIFSLPAINVTSVSASIRGYASNFANGLVIYRTTVLSPLGDSRGLLYLGAESSVVESVMQPLIQDIAGATVDSRIVGNVANVAGINAGVTVNGSGPIVAAGYVTGLFGFAGGLVNGELKRDVIVGAPLNIEQGGIGAAYLGANVNVWVSLFVGHESVPVWGPGTINVFGQGHIFYGLSVGSIATAVGTFVNGGDAGAITLNSNSNACSISGDSGAVVNCGIPITPANLDADAGVAGFGGRAFLPGGASVVNGGP